MAFGGRLQAEMGSLKVQVSPREKSEDQQRSRVANGRNHVILKGDMSIFAQTASTCLRAVCEIQSDFLCEMVLFLPRLWNPPRSFMGAGGEGAKGGGSRNKPLLSP